MKILFVVNNRIQDPIGVMQLSSILKCDGHQIDLVAYQNDDVYERVKSFKPDIIGYSVMTGSEDKFLQLNRNLKSDFKFLSVWGGPHPTFFPEIINERGVDIVVRGEAEISIKKVLISMLPGVYEVETLIEDLDTLPLPDRGLNDLSSLDSRISNFRTVVFNRGCPYHCSYCFEYSKRSLYKGKGKYLRFKNISKAVEEIKLIEKTVPKEYREYIDIRDSTFIINKKWAIEFLTVSKKETTTPLTLNVRADLIDLEIAEALKNSNVFAVTMGVESGDDYLNSHVLKKGFCSKDIIDACKILRKVKVDYFFDNIIAIPGEKPQQALKTLALSVKCRPKFSSAMIFMPYPRTALTEYAYNKGLITNRFPKISSETYHTSSLLNFSKEEIQEFKRLHDLFPIVTQFGFLFPFINFLLRLPLDELYERTYYAFNRAFKRVCMSPNKISAIHKFIPSSKFCVYFFRNVLSIIYKANYRTI